MSLAAWVWVAAGVVGVALMALLFRWNAASGGEIAYGPAGQGEEGKTQNVGMPAAVPKSERRGAGREAGRTAWEAPAGPKEGAQGSKQRHMGPRGNEEIAGRSRARPRAEPTPDRTREGGASATLVAGVAAGENPGDTPARVSKPNVLHSQPGVSPDLLARRSVKTAASPKEGAPASRSYFVGHWFFSEDVSRRDATMYRPEMIEVAITEENGVLRGKYRGRYRVTDRPISPDVNFEFSGPAGEGEAAELGWSGSEAEGGIRLTGMTPVSMEVKWWATRRGALDLTSGTAVLIRAEEK